MIIVRGELIMYRTLDGVEWMKPLMPLKFNLKQKEIVFGRDVSNVIAELNKYYKTIDEKVYYKVMLIQTNLGLFTVSTNFVKECPIFLPLKDNYEPVVIQFLSTDGFRPDIEPPPNIDEILSQYTKYEGGEA